MKLNLVLAVICVLLVSINAAAFVPTEGPGFFEKTSFRGIEPDKVASKSFELLDQNSDGVWMVRWNARTGLPASIIGAGNHKYSGTPLEIASNFLSQFGDIYRFDTTYNRNGDDLGDLEPLKIQTEAGSSHVVFTQNLEGTPVFASGLTVHISPEGEVRQVTGEYVPTEKVTGAWSITADNALDAALASIGSRKMRIYPRLTQPKIEKQYYFDGEKLVCSWLVNVATDQPLGDWQIIIDADSGELLFRNNLINSFERATGSGTVYQVHPHAGDPVKRNLLHMNSLSALVSKYVKVFNEDVAEASEADGRYHYDTENTHFDEAMLYYHVISIRDFFADFGFNGLDNGINATCHKGTDYDNAYYSPWGGGLFFGDGNYFNPLAWEASVVMHEYTHAVTGNIISMAYSSESGAMNEAFSDYFPCSIEKDKLVGEYVAARRPTPYLRSMENTKIYPDDMENEVHRDSEVYSGALWTLEKRIGAKVTRTLAHRSRYHLSYRARFVDGLDGMIAVDRDLYNGKYENDIREVFAKRGIVSSTATLNELLAEKSFFRTLENLR